MAARRRKKSRKSKRSAARKPVRSARKQAARPKHKKAARPKHKKAAARKRTPAKRRPAQRKPRANPSRKRRAPARKAGAVEARPAARERLAAGVPVEVGVVVHWFPRASAAVVALSHPVHVGDTIHVRGHSTDFVQQVASLTLEGAPVGEGAPPQTLGVRLEARARPGDRVYRISW
jgi:putative protease